MANWGRVQGDLNDTITVGMNGVDSLADVDFIVVWATLDHTSAELVGTVLNAEGVYDDFDRRIEPPSISVALNPWLSEDPDEGEWELDYEVHYLNGTVKTWPESDDRDYIKVRKRK